MKHVFMLAREEEELLLVEGRVHPGVCLPVCYPEPQNSCLVSTLQWHVTPNRSKTQP